jgi:SAM-dependent methyltransferase
MNYPGKELEIFDKANFWRRYLFFLIQKFIGKDVLEVGAGIGSFTKTYYNKNKNITLSEIDDSNFKSIKNIFSNKENVNVTNSLIGDVKKTFDTILYLSVLEHIEDDKNEISMALDRLKYNGYLVICVPAHNYMYSNFDKEIGHFRRYNINFFKELNLKNTILKKCYFFDSIGYLLYFVNKIFFKKEVYPSKFKIFIWDKIFVPFSYIIDFFSLYKFGKNIICVIQKKID